MVSTGMLVGLSASLPLGHRDHAGSHCRDLQHRLFKWQPVRIDVATTTATPEGVPLEEVHGVRVGTSHQQVRLEALAESVCGLTFPDLAPDSGSLPRPLKVPGPHLSVTYTRTTS